MPNGNGPIARIVTAATRVAPNEIRATALSFAFLFMLMLAYNILKPIRDAMASDWSDPEVATLWTINFFISMRKEERAEENPWQATTLEWATPTPPPHGNFLRVPVVDRGPYEYSVPGADRDFSPQFVAQEE